MKQVHRGGRPRLSKRRFVAGLGLARPVGVSIYDAVQYNINISNSVNNN